LAQLGLGGFVLLNRKENGIEKGKGGKERAEREKWGHSG